MAGETVIARWHAQLTRDQRLVRIVDRELVIAEHIMPGMPQFRRHRQERVIALPVSVDEIPEMDDKRQLLPVEISHGRRKFGWSRVIEPLTTIGFSGILRIGDRADAEVGTFIRHGGGRRAGKPRQSRQVHHEAHRPVRSDRGRRPL